MRLSLVAGVATVVVTQNVAALEDLQILPTSTNSECTALLGVNFPYGTDNIAGSCGNQGECVPFNGTSLNPPTDPNITEYICECNEGWTGNSDWINAHGYDCQVSTLGVNILWGLNLLETHYFFFVKAAPVLYARYKQYKVTKKTLADRGRTYRARDNRGIVAVIIFYTVCHLGHVLYAVHRIAFPQERLGFNLVPTLLFAFTKIGLYVSNWLFSPALFQAVLRGQKNMESIVKANDVAAFSAAAITVLLGFLPIINYMVYYSNGWVPNEQLNTTTWQVYLAMMSATMLVYGFLARMVKRNVIDVLDKSYSMAKKQSTLRMRDKLADFQHEITKQAWLQAVLYLFILLFPWMWTKHDYFLPISWLAMPILGFKVAATADDHKRGGLKGATGTATSRTKGQSRTDGGGSYSKTNQYSRTNQNSFNPLTKPGSILDSYAELDEDKVSEMEAGDDFMVISPSASTPAPPLPAGAPPAPPS